jgi:hypothetical protein
MDHAEACISIGSHAYFDPLVEAREVRDDIGRLFMPCEIRPCKQWG